MPYISAVAILSGAAFGQSLDATLTMPNFEVSDIHASAPTIRPYMNGPFLHAGRYQLKTATMVDLIGTAYGVDSDKVYGGPNWLEFDRFDVLAKIPPGTKPETVKLMLQALLADRFKLAIHNDTKPFTAYSLTAGKNPKLKESDGSGQTGCGFRAQGLQPPPGGGPVAMPTSFTLTAECHSVSVTVFANSIRGFIAGSLPNGVQGNPQVLDNTGLKGLFDLELKFPIAMNGGPGDGDTNIIDAVDKQLGLKLEMVKVPLPVIVVDSANRKPTDNSPDAAKSFPPLPTEFDVAEIKPSAPIPAGGRGGRGSPPFQNDRVNLQGITLKALINLAWDIAGEDMLAGAPKWADSDRFDLIAKVPAAVMASPVTPGGRVLIDQDVYRPMIRALLIDKFKLTVHYEDRPVNAYILSAAKPKLQKADPANRTTWIEGPGPDGKDPRKANPAVGRLVTCRNMTMAEFAALLPGIASGYLRTQVQDATGLEGAWDFTLSFSGAGIVNGAGGRGGDPGAMAGGPPGSAPAAAADPSGGLSLFDAVSKQLGLKLEMQKRPMPVLVIDHVEQKPADN
jgi:uncharacterized protein (TIGR03435 family)